MSGIPSEEAFGTPTLWGTANFAVSWYQDACSEALIVGERIR
jgi:hypothetical protein